MLKHFTLTLALLSFSPLLIAQTEVESEVEMSVEDEFETDSLSGEQPVEKPKKNFKVYTAAQVMPQFKGGPRARAQYLRSQIQYPPVGPDEKIEGTITASFIVMKDGTIIEPRIIKGMSPELDEEVLSVIKNMPLWIPGRQHNVPVAVQYFLPVRIKVEGVNVAAQ